MQLLLFWWNKNKVRLGNFLIVLALTDCLTWQVSNILLNSRHEAVKRQCFRSYWFNKIVNVCSIWKIVAVDFIKETHFRTIKSIRRILWSGDDKVFDLTSNANELCSCLKHCQSNIFHLRNYRKNNGHNRKSFNIKFEHTFSTAIIILNWRNFHPCFSW